MKKGLVLNKSSISKHELKMNEILMKFKPKLEEYLDMV
jgi:hypothetical protein